MENTKENEKRFKKHFASDAVVTAENVQELGEIVAISALKKVMAFSGRALDDLYARLVHDIYDYKPIDEPYSDGYDLAQTAICFLCEHMGKNLKSIYTIDHNGRNISVLQKCYRTVYNEIERVRGNIYNTISYDSLEANDEPYIEAVDTLEANDDNTDAIIEQMHLNQGQLDTLNCYMAGMGFVEIAKLLSVNLATVWRRRQIMQQKYSSIL